MSKIEWLKWMVKYGNPRTRSQNLRRFFAFEVYSLGCRLSGYKITHWLKKGSLTEKKIHLGEPTCAAGSQAT